MLRLAQVRGELDRAPLPRLLERAGNFANGGSITAFYTVLVEGDDMNDPIADSVRSILDGHIVLDRELASRGHYPCIDVLSSNSRLMSHLVDDNVKNAAYEIRDLMATYKKSEDLINTSEGRATALKLKAQLQAATAH